MHLASRKFPFSARTGSSIHTNKDVVGYGVPFLEVALDYDLRQDHVHYCTEVL